MIVDSLGMEFGYELQVAIPYAYYLFSIGKLKGTISAIDTKSLYYFSPNHQEKYKIRQFVNLKNTDFPNKNIHVASLDWTKWFPPPYKHVFYKGKTYDWIIFNKYTEEWGESPINFLSIETLNSIFNLIYSYKPDAEILYSRMVDGALDHQKTFDLQDENDLLNSHEIERFESIPCESPNKLKMELMAGCDNFISVQGGATSFASYFGLKNFIFVKRGSELIKNSYQWFNKFAGTNIIVSQTDFDLLNNIEKELNNV